MAEKRSKWGPKGGTAGTCTTCGEPARSPIAFYCNEHNPKAARTKPAEAPSGESVPSPTPEGAGGAYTDISTNGAATPERRPSEPKGTKPKLLDRFKKTPSGSDAGETRPGSGERRPAAAPKRRVSTTSFWGDLVEGGASVVGRAGYVPAARAMTWSSPVAGEIIEDATKGTPIDRLVQPVVRNAEKWQDLFDLIGFWGAIGVAQANPAQAPAAMGFARKRLINLLPRIATNITKQRAKEKAAVEALTEVMPDLRELFPDADPDADPVDLLLQSLFAAPPQPAQPEPAHAA